MDDDDRLVKRPRIDDVPVARRDPYLYFHDGNVVLCAEGCVSEPVIGPTDAASVNPPSNEAKSVITYFRVHQSILSLQSPVFRDMFSLPQGPDTDTGETYDGLHPVRLYDTAQELSNFLRVFYDPYFVSAAPYTRGYASSMLGPLKLANKYQVAPLRDQIIARLREIWPKDLEDYDAFRTQSRSCQEIFDTISLVLAGRIQDEVPYELAFMYYCVSVISTLGRVYSIDPAYFRIMFKGRRCLDKEMVSWKGPQFQCQHTPSECQRERFQETFQSILVKDDNPLKFFSKLCLACSVTVRSYMVEAREKCFASIIKNFQHLVE
ncbi:hypothetical protein HGRIS_011863 [Hohenbuehelia grisea]|uniref:BTB domain-containing protein n=1 Tax=Hohenbuehelia grisea TaxID=104357 RepID=A0ABR3JWD5_9AGAR